MTPIYCNNCVVRTKSKSMEYKCMTEQRDHQNDMSNLMHSSSERPHGALNAGLRLYPYNPEPNKGVQSWKSGWQSSSDEWVL